MKAALFEVDGIFGHERYIFQGEKASAILGKLENVQDLGCLLQMGRTIEDSAGQEQLDTLEELLEKYYSGELTMKDLQTFDIALSIGTMKCTAIAESDEEIEKLIASNPDAR